MGSPPSISTVSYFSINPLSPRSYPVSSQFVPVGLKQRKDSLHNLLVVVIEPVHLLCGEHGVVDQFGLEGDQGHGLEAEEIAWMENMCVFLLMISLLQSHEVHYFCYPFRS